MSLTPEQFNKIALKTDLDRLEKKVEKIDKRFNEVLTAIDNLTNSVKYSKEEKTVNQAAHDRMSEDIKTIDSRVEKLEIATA